MVIEYLEQHTNAEYLLLLQLKEGKELAFNYFYQHYSLNIYRKIRKMVKIESLADELMQDVFVKVWDRRHLIDPEKSFQSYLFIIAQNLVYDHYRKISREGRLRQEIKQDFIEEYLHLEEGLILKETQGMLEKAVSLLPAQQQLVFRLCKFENKSYQQVSDQLGISTSTINGHIVKASKSIKAYLLSHNSLPLHLVLISIISSINKHL